MKAPTVAAIIMIIENDLLVLSPESSMKIDTIELRSCNKCSWPIKACTYSIMTKSTYYSKLCSMSQYAYSYTDEAT